MADRRNILEGTSRIFVGTANTDTLPADTVAFGGAWGGAWRDMGYTTDDGVTITLNQTFNPVATAQDRNPVLHLRGATDDRIACTLLEATLTNIREATGRGSVVSVAPVGATPGHDELTLSSDAGIRYVAIGFEGVAPPNEKSNPRRVLFPNALATASVALNQRIGAAMGIPCEFSLAGGQGGSVVIRDVTTS